MKNDKNQRRSSIELFRIITMFIIVAHHYVVNSGLLDVIVENGFMKPNSIFLLLFGWGGKTGINCFVLISGYFMCKSHITVKKIFENSFRNLFLQNIVLFDFLIYGLFGVHSKIICKINYTIHKVAD